MKRPKSKGFRWICAGFLMLLAQINDRAQVSVYHVPKEKTAAVAEAPAPVVSSKPLDWVTPSGWKELPGDSMRVATFAITAQPGKQAQVTIVPIGGHAGTMADNVNRWRNQLGLEPIEPSVIPGQLSSVIVGSDRGQLYEVAGSLQAGEQGRGTRLTVAILSRDDTAWFFKMIGDDSLVAEQKPAFLQFLKSISFNQANNRTLSTEDLAGRAPVAGADFASIHKGMNLGGDFSAPVVDAGNHPKWQVPANWKQVGASPMLAAKFQVSDAGNQRAEINVSTSSGLGGGAVANINRWRGQLGLGPVDQAGLDKLISNVDLARGKGMLVDMNGADPESGDSRRLVALIVPLADQTWFFKLMGSARVVEKEKAALIQFVQSAQFNAH
ncbi:MAG TPA: hypothetical protein VFB72_07465 [Verrucomicrobiae bacterium]|nr:hypothetical protein [Verrucomicrobiae bacterium]